MFQIWTADFQSGSWLFQLKLGSSFISWEKSFFSATKRHKIDLFAWYSLHLMYIHKENLQKWLWRWIRTVGSTQVEAEMGRGTDFLICAREVDCGNLFPNWIAAAINPQTPPPCPRFCWPCELSGDGTDSCLGELLKTVPYLKKLQQWLWVLWVYEETCLLPRISRIFSAF